MPARLSLPAQLCVSWEWEQGEDVGRRFYCCTHILGFTLDKAIESVIYIVLSLTKILLGM